MMLDKTQAAAVAAWSRFEADVSESLLRAVSAAYALVACADGDLDRQEVTRYVEVAQGDSRFESLDASRLEHALRALWEALTTDVEGGRDRAMEYVLAAKAEGSEVMLASARIALEADEKVGNAETEAMRAICKALGVNPRQHLPDV